MPLVECPRRYYMREYRVYNHPNCSCFDLIGTSEPEQTMAFGYLLAKSDIALKTFLGLLFPKGQVRRLMDCKCVVDCEMINTLPNQKPQRADIVLRFSKNYSPVHVVIIEAKSACVHINNHGATSQVNVYQTMPHLQGFPHKSIVTLTTIVTGLDTNVMSIKWSDLISELMRVVNGVSWEVELIRDYVEYILRIQNIMNFYDNEVMVIPAGKSAAMASDPACGIYECPVGGRQYNARAQSHPLFIALVGRAGRVDALYKVSEIIRLDIQDQQAIDTMRQSLKYTSVANRIDYYRQNASFPLPAGERWIFVLDHSKSVTLPYTVFVRKMTRNHHFKNLADFIQTPQQGAKRIYI